MDFWYPQIMCFFRSLETNQPSLSIAKCPGIDTIIKCWIPSRHNCQYQQTHLYSYNIKIKGYCAANTYRQNCLHVKPSHISRYLPIFQADHKLRASHSLMIYYIRRRESSLDARRFANAKNRPHQNPACGWNSEKLIARRLQNPCTPRKMLCYID